MVQSFPVNLNRRNRLVRGSREHTDRSGLSSLPAAVQGPAAQAPVRGGSDLPPVPARVLCPGGLQPSRGSERASAHANNREAEDPEREAPSAKWSSSLFAGQAAKPSCPPRQSASPIENPAPWRAGLHRYLSRECEAHFSASYLQRLGSHLAGTAAGPT